MNSEIQRLQNGIAVVLLAGDLDLAGLKQFKEEIKILIDEGSQKIIVDCRELGKISSSGLASLMWARALAGKVGGSIYLTHVSALVNDVLRVTKLSSLLKIERSTRELLQKLSGIRKSPGKPRGRLRTSSVEYRSGKF